MTNWSDPTVYEMPLRGASVCSDIPRPQPGTARELAKARALNCVISRRLRVSRLVVAAELIWEGGKLVEPGSARPARVPRSHFQRQSRRHEHVASSTSAPSLNMKEGEGTPQEDGAVEQSIHQVEADATHFGTNIKVQSCGARMPRNALRK